MHDDVVRKSVENLRPLLVRLGDLGEQAGILQGHGRMSGQGQEHLFIIARERAPAICKAEHTQQFPTAADQTGDGQIVPVQAALEFSELIGVDPAGRGIGLLGDAGEILAEVAHVGAGDLQARIFEDDAFLGRAVGQA